MVIVVLLWVDPLLCRHCSLCSSSGQISRCGSMSKICTVTIYIGKVCCTVTSGCFGFQKWKHKFESSLLSYSCLTQVLLSLKQLYHSLICCSTHTFIIINPFNFFSLSPSFTQNLKQILSAVCFATLNKCIKVMYNLQNKDSICNYHSCLAVTKGFDVLENNHT